MKEREDIISNIQKKLWEIPGVKLVDRNTRKIPELETFPAIYILDGVDKPVAPSTRPVRDTKRLWNIAIQGFVQGSDESAAPQELAELMGQIKYAIFETSPVVGRLYRGAINEVQTDPLDYPDMGNFVVSQLIAYEIRYVETLP